MHQRICKPRVGRLSAAALMAASFALPFDANASFLAGEALDKMADIVAWAVLVLVPIGVLTLFWIIHVMPEKIAERRHHPQQQAIKVLCLLSLVFGGLLWPLAWLWAYTRPTAFRMAYGTEKHESYFIHAVEKAERGEMSAEELEYLRDELGELAVRGSLGDALRGLPARAAAASAAVVGQAQPGKEA